MALPRLRTRLEICVGAAVGKPMSWAPRAQRRTFSFYSPHLRPRLPSSGLLPALSPSAPSSIGPGFVGDPTAARPGPAHVGPRPSSHPALCWTQLRFAPRNTFRANHKKRKRKLGFLARLKTRGGRNVLKRRRAKGRKNLSH